MVQSLKAELTGLIVEACSALGFKKRKGLYFSRQISPETVGLIAFGFGNDDGLFVDPSAGLIHEPIERLVTELAALPRDPYRVTLGAYLGNIPPVRGRVLWYRVPEGGTAHDLVDEMMTSVKGIAVPWLEEHTTIDSFIRDLEAGIATLREPARLRLPLAYYLKSEFETARKILQDTLQEMRVKPPKLIVADYPAFAARLLGRMPDGHSTPSEEGGA